MNQKPSRGCTVHFPFTHLPYSKYSSDTLTQFVPRGVSNLLLSLSQCFFWPPSFTQTRHLHLVSFEPFFLLALLPETFLPIARDCLDFPPFPDMFSDDHFNLWHTWTLSMLSIYKPLFPFLDPLSFFLPLPPPRSPSLTTVFVCLVSSSGGKTSSFSFHLSILSWPPFPPHSLSFSREIHARYEKRLNCFSWFISCHAN